MRTKEETDAARWRTCRVCGRRYGRIDEERLPHDYYGRRSQLNWPTGQEYGLCSSACYRTWHAHKERERRKLLAPSYRVACRSCGEAFTAKRSDARYCSTRCRVADHRRRVYRTEEHRAHGWELACNEAGYPGIHQCAWVVVTGHPCAGATVWKLQRLFKSMGQVQVSYWCDEHREMVGTSDIRVDELPTRVK